MRSKSRRDWKRFAITFNAKESEGAVLGRVQCRDDRRTVVLAADDRRRSTSTSAERIGWGAVPTVAAD